MSDAPNGRPGKTPIRAEPSQAKPTLPRGKSGDHPGENAPCGEEAVDVAKTNDHLLPSRRTPRG